jgi:hypothetical protein
LEPFAAFHMKGHWDEDGTQLAAAIDRVVTKHADAQPKRRAFPWWLVRIAAPFMITLRELLEMRYLWRHPVRMNNDKLRAVLVEEPHTTLDAAVEATLIGLGCLHRRS